MLSDRSQTQKGLLPFASMYMDRNSSEVARGWAPKKGLTTKGGKGNALG